MEIEINSKKFQLKELKYLDIVELANLTDKKLHTIKIFELSGVSEEITKNLSPKEGSKLMECINELNGFGDFQKASASS